MSRITRLPPAKEAAFAHDFLEFANQKFGATATKGWRVMIEHIDDAARWMGLSDVAQKVTEHDPWTWNGNNGWSFAWDMKDRVKKEFHHLTDPAQRKQYEAYRDLKLRLQPICKSNSERLDYFPERRIRCPACNKRTFLALSYRTR